MSEGELKLMALEEEMDGLVRWAESDLPDTAVRLAKSVQEDVRDLVAEVRRLRGENQHLTADRDAVEMKLKELVDAGAKCLRREENGQ